MNKEQQVINWIRSKQNELDKIIFNAGEEYYKNLICNNSQLQYDAKITHNESFNLSKGKDLCYDRPTIGFTYSLYYHPRRINTFLNYFIKAFINTSDKEVQIFDLGAGTGAVQYAIGLIYCGLKNLGYDTPSLTIINIDTSPFMLYYNRDYLWKHFLDTNDFKDAKEIKPEYEVNSWNNNHKLDFNNPWVVASYLFDHSENQDEIAKDFKEIVDKFKPSTITLLTSEQPTKKIFLNNIAKVIEKKQYEDKKISDILTSKVFSGDLKNVNILKNKLGFGGNPSKWDDYSFYGKLLMNKVPLLNLSFNSKKDSVNKISLYNPPIVVRREIELNDDQKKAAEINNRPTCITGPAGCGKSIVITEKVKNLLIQEKYNPNLKILFTTFNKELVNVLVKWLKQILDLKECEFFLDRKKYYIKFKNSRIRNIRILHFDVLPTYIGGLRIGNLNIRNDKFHRNKLKPIVENYRRENSIDDSSLENILNSDFMFEEFQRVVYGLQYFKESDYMEGKRGGRGTALVKERRKIVWEVINKYLLNMKNENYYSFTSIRYMFLKKLYPNKNNIEKFDFIFVDEFQDCSKAEFEIFYNLIKDPNNLTVVGDLAQALQLGSSAHVPRNNGDIRMRNFDYKRLNGSYRLPLRICECLRELSNEIYKKQNPKRDLEDEDLSSKLLPYKGAPPGATPIIVYGRSLIDITRKLIDIFKKYKIYDIDKITVLEKDDELKNSINRDINCEADSVLRIKGLEKTCVLWSTRMEIDFENEVEEFVYTILTRTSSILIIALSNKTLTYYKNVLKSFNNERIICWDEGSKNKYEEIIEN